jgi:hypothetical protein
MSKLNDYTDELKWLQAMAKELAKSEDKAEAKRYKGVNFFQGLWGYKEVGLFLGIAPMTVIKAEFRVKLPALSMWQAKGTAKKAGQQVLRWRPIDVFHFREEKERQANARSPRSLIAKLRNAKTA